MIGLTFICALAVAIDGDTLRCSSPLPDGNFRVRLARIDAPERGEQGWHEARAALSGLAFERQIECEQVDADPRIDGFQWHDRFGRIVARCAAAGVSLERAMLDLGHAQAWPKENEAR